MMSFQSEAADRSSFSDRVGSVICRSSRPSEATSCLALWCGSWAGIRSSSSRTSRRPLGRIPIQRRLSTRLNSQLPVHFSKFGRAFWSHVICFQTGVFNIVPPCIFSSKSQKPRLSSSRSSRTYYSFSWDHSSLYRCRFSWISCFINFCTFWVWN